MMKNVNLQIEVEIKPEVIWRLKLFMAIMRFAVWVGGFGGVEFDIPDRHLTPRALDVATVCPNCGCQVSALICTKCGTPIPATQVT